MKEIFVLNQETSKKMKIEVEDGMMIQTLMQTFRTKGLIDVSSPYHLKSHSINGEIYPAKTMFRDIKEKEFILVSGPPPPSPAFLQLGIFVIDGSGSMTEGTVSDGILQPNTAVDQAMKSLILHFQKSSKNECFSFSAVAFGDTAHIMLTPTKVKDISPSKSFLATNYFNGGNGSLSTNISSGLIVAEELAQKFLDNKRGGLIHEVVIVVLTDGICHHQAETRAVAARLKQILNVKLFSCHLETGLSKAVAVTLLKDISNKYETVYNEATIRDFFIASQSTYLG